MIMLATHKRPENLQRFIAAYQVTEASEKVMLVIDKDDDSYDAILPTLPASFDVMRIEPGQCASMRANLAYEWRPNEPYYAIMGDDVVPMTKHWDKILREAAGDWNISYCADGMQNEKLTTHPFIGGELVRAQGFVEEPSMGDWFADNCRTDVGAELGLLRYVKEVEYDHRHHLAGKAVKDATYAKQRDHHDDAMKYVEWRFFGGFARTVNKIKAALPA